MKLTDSEIIGNIKKGDNESFRIIAEEFKDKAFSLILRILKNKEEAEDCLQESFLKLYRSITGGKFEERSKLSTYFYTIVYNTAVDSYKRLKSRRFSIVSIDVDGSNFEDGDDLLKKYYESNIEKREFDDKYDFSTESRISESEIKKIISDYINSIPEQYSVILNLFYINDLSHEEIAEILKLPLGTIKNRIFRAKSKLKEIILKKFSEEEILQYV
ncbi:MAG: sigma-70 family RNA polymerase sigma factor [Bacteroidetes bacterium]|nr:sigma-70 family RNA polymerase sigma factor [Bacteroidota bacterium]